MGDCVSVPNDYFGSDYLLALQTAGFAEDRVYGRVVRLISGSQLFVVKWDIEGDETRTSLSKVTIEANDTPIQRPDPVNIQESSATAVKSHALLEENGIDMTVYDLI